MESLRSFKIENDDIVIQNGKLQMIEKDPEVCQCVERAITTRLEEFFLNAEHGMDYTEYEQKAPNIELLKFAVIEAAMQEKRLKNIDIITVDFNKAKRTARLDFIGTLISDEQIQGSVVI